MKSLTSLLARYTHIQAPDATLKRAFIKAVENILEVSLDEKDITISKNTVFIHAPSVIKHEIRVNQQEILKEVGKEVSNTTALTAVV